jgi:hypothetical protein
LKEEDYQKARKKDKQYFFFLSETYIPCVCWWMIYMKHASLMRFAVACSTQVTTRIRAWWLNVTVTLFWIHAAWSEFWLIGCHHKSNTGSKDDQKQKYGGFWPKKERSLEDTHLFFLLVPAERMWINWEQGFFLYEFHTMNDKEFECSFFKFGHAKTRIVKRIYSRPPCQADHRKNNTILGKQRNQ